MTDTRSDNAPKRIANRLDGIVYLRPQTAKPRIITCLPGKDVEVTPEEYTALMSNEAAVALIRLMRAGRKAA